MLVPPISECNISVICMLCIYVSVFVLITLPLIKNATDKPLVHHWA